MEEIEFLKAMLRDLETHIEVIRSRIKKLSANGGHEITTKYAPNDLIKENSNMDWE